MNILGHILKEPLIGNCQDQKTDSGNIRVLGDRADGPLTVSVICYKMAKINCSQGKGSREHPRGALGVYQELFHF